MRLSIALVCWVLVAPALAINIANVTISDTLLVPAGETGDLSGTVTFDGGMIEVDGSLSSSLNVGDIHLVGTGRIELNTPSSGWGFRCCYSNVMTIGPEIEIVGAPGASYGSGDSILRGMMAAVDGATSEPFQVFIWNDFVNEGTLEARSGALMEITGLSHNPNFSQAGILRALPGGVMQFVQGALTSLEGLGTIDNQGEMQFRRTAFDVGGGELEFPTGDWTLLDGVSLTGGTVSTATGGRLLVRDYKPYTSYNTLPNELRDVVLATDVHILGGAVALAGATTFDDVTVYLSASGASLHFDAAMATLGGTGSIIADGGTSRLYVSGPLMTIAEGIALESRGGTLVLDKLGSGSVAYDIAGPVTADGGEIEIATPTTTRGSVLIGDGSLLDVKAPLQTVGALDVELGGQLALNALVTNEGPVTISGGILSLNSLGDFASPANVSLENSLVVHSGQRTLANLTKYTGQGVDYGVGAGNLNLEGGTITIGSTPGTRWFIYRDSVLRNGVVNSVDGGEVTPTVPEGVLDKPRATLTDIELNADARVPFDTTLSLTGALTGTGQLIVDGGQLVIGTTNGDSTSLVHSVLTRIDPRSGKVALQGTIQNQGQTLHLPAGVRWGLGHVRANGIVGGRVEGEPGAELHIDSGYGGYGAGVATFNGGVTLALPVVVYGTGAYVRGGLTLDNTHVTIGAPTTSTFFSRRLVFLDEQTLGGVGEVRFGPTSGSGVHFLQVSSELQSAGLIIGAQVAVRTAEGNGRVLGQDIRGNIQDIALTNHGRLIAENGHRLELFTSDFAQLGTLRSETDSLLVVHDDDVVNHGRLELAGGEMVFTGDLTQAPGSVLAIELSSELLASVEAPLQIAGDLVLDGGLEVSFADGFSLAVGDRFPLLSAASVQGGFLSIVGPALAEGFFWRPETMGGELWLSVADDPLPGDYNFDGIVNAADYTVWRNDLGATGPGLVADGDGDMEVDAGDYEVWRANYGSGGAMLAAAEGVRVPEPAGWVLVFGLSTGAFMSRRLKRGRRRVQHVSVKRGPSTRCASSPPAFSFPSPPSWRG